MPLTEHQITLHFMWDLEPFIGLDAHGDLEIQYEIWAKQGAAWAKVITSAITAHVEDGDDPVTRHETIHMNAPDGPWFIHIWELGGVVYDEDLNKYIVTSQYESGVGFMFSIGEDEFLHTIHWDIQSQA